MTRSRDWEDISRGVQNRDVLPEAYMDEFTASREIPSQFRRRSTKKLSASQALLRLNAAGSLLVSPSRCR